MISGNVEARDDISSTTARLTGTAGQEIKETLTLSPSRENPFEITTIEAEKGDNIRYDLAEIQRPDGEKYLLTIYNTKKDPGWYLDKVHIKTSSSLTPEFTISVFGVIRDGT